MFLYLQRNEPSAGCFLWTRYSASQWAYIPLSGSTKPPNSGLIISTLQKRKLRFRKVM